MGASTSDDAANPYVTSESAQEHISRILNSPLSNSQLMKEYLQRLINGRDMRVYITAQNSATGVGKTTLAIALAILWDQWGWTVDKATLDPREFSAKIDEVPPGSALILDEAEQALEARRSQSKENVEISHDFATKRVGQVFGIMTLPTKSMMDGRITDKLSDFWIQCQERSPGTATVYRLGNNEHYETDYTKKEETIEWPPLDHWDIYEKLHEKKIERVYGGEQSKYIRREEFEEAKKNFYRKFTMKTRYQLVRAMYRHPDLSQSDIAKITKWTNNDDIAISQQRVSDLVNANDFSEVYSA